MKGIWVRSQDKSVLVCTSDLWIISNACDEHHGVHGDEYLLGVYSTEEKAIKVLDTIQRFMYKYEDSAYQMPLDEEVVV